MNRICYTGGVYDSSTELYYLNARYYDSGIGRFLTCDSYRGELESTETLNLYVYCASNPISYIDPSGHTFEVIFDVISVGWSIYDMVVDPSLENAAFLIYDVGAAILPIVPASRTYRSIISTKKTLKAPSKAKVKQWKKVRKNKKRPRTAIKPKRAFADGNAGEAALTKSLASSGYDVWNHEVFMTRYKGREVRRIVDFYANNIAHESKVGYMTLSARLREEIDKDVYLLTNNKLNPEKQVDGVTWHFYRSAKTGKIGGSKRLMNYLRKNNIKVIIHY